MKQSWPQYADANGVYVSALPIKSIKQTIEGYAVASFDGNYKDQNLSSHFMSIFRPVVGGYLFTSASGELLYMSKTAFEAQYSAAGTAVTWTSVTGKPTTFAPVIGTTATTAMAGNKAPTSTDRGGVLQQAAITAITDSSGGTSGGNTVAAVPAATAATTDTSAASLASTNAAIAAIKNDFATLSAKYNALLAAVKAAGITA
ncbi:hypothetical protein ACMS02_001390 [Cronobacter turicensis]|nr:hypothetical protein [Cronobacter turicensis]